MSAALLNQIFKSINTFMLVVGIYVVGVLVFVGFNEYKRRKELTKISETMANLDLEIMEVETLLVQTRAQAIPNVSIERITEIVSRYRAIRNQYATTYGIMVEYYDLW
jgi:flagellar biosynthesis component FlhA